MSGTESPPDRAESSPRDAASLRTLLLQSRKGLPQMLEEQRRKGMISEETYRRLMGLFGE